MSIDKLLRSLSANTDKKQEGKVSFVCSDSRKARPGCVFVALKGRKTDGHNYLESAIKNGAKAVVVERAGALKGKTFKGLVCEVENTRKTLPLLLNTFYDYPSEKMFCVGVTGTNGKTTVSSLLSFLFSRLGWRAGLIGTVKNQFENYEEKSTLTTPDPVKLHSLLHRFYRQGAQAVVMEVSSIGLDQQRVEGVDFNMGVFTNLSEDHLDYHANKEEYFQAKKKLFTSFRNNHFMAVLNFDDPYGVKIGREITAPYISYGKKQARFFYEIISADLSGMRFNLFFEDQKISAYLPMPGLYNVSNAVAALACAHSAGFSLKKAVEALKSFPGLSGRMEKACKKPLVFVDYAHTPQALESVLKFLCFIRADGGTDKSARLFTVFGCGGGRDREKRPLMAQVAERFSDQVILTSDNPREEDPMDIIQSALKGARDKNKFLIELDRKKAVEQVLKSAKKTDIILIAGKGHEREQITGFKRTPFSDIEIVKKHFNR